MKTKEGLALIAITGIVVGGACILSDYLTHRKNAKKQAEWMEQNKLTDREIEALIKAKDVVKEKIRAGYYMENDISASEDFEFLKIRYMTW